MNNLQTFFKKFSWKINGRLFGFNTSPEADWKIIFVSTLILACFIIVLSVLMFVRIDKGEIFVINKPAEEGAKILDVAVLKETVLYYQNKALEFERIKNVRTTSVDPSL